MHKSRRPAEETQCWLIHPLERMKNSHPGTSSFFLGRRNNLVLVSDGRNLKKQPFQIAQRYLFRTSSAEQWDSPCGPLSLQGAKAMRKASSPVHFLVWWLSTAHHPMSPAPDMWQQSGRRTTNHLTHWKGLWMGSMPYISEEPKHCLKLVKTNTPWPPSKHTAKNHQKHTRRGKGGWGGGVRRGSAMRFHSDLKKLRGCKWKRK